jgi:hypothetical protein
MQRLIVMAGVVLALFCAPLTAVAQAGQPVVSERLQLSRRFVNILQANQIGAMVAQLSTSMTPERNGLTAVQREAFDDVMEIAATEMMGSLLDALAPVYADIFTVEELRGLVAFYESDIGKSMMRKSAAATPKMMEVIYRIMPELMADMGNTICDETGCTDKERTAMLAAMAEESPFAAPSTE